METGQPKQKRGRDGVDSGQDRLQAFLAHQDIKACIARFARGEDRRDAAP
jgi:hypothetical protein